MFEVRQHRKLTAEGNERIPSFLLASPDLRQFSLLVAVLQVLTGFQFTGL